MLSYVVYDTYVANDSPAAPSTIKTVGRGRENHARQRSRHVTLNFCYVNLIRLLFHPLKKKTCVFTYTHQAGARLSLSIKEVDQTTGEDLMPGRGHEAAAKLADELKSNPSGPAGAAAGGKAASNPLHPGLTQERLRAMEAEEEVIFFFCVVWYQF